MLAVGAGGIAVCKPIVETDDYVPTERVALVVWHLAHGDTMSTAEIAGMIGVTRYGAYKLMARLSRVLPIRQINDAWEVGELRELLA